MKRTMLTTLVLALFALSLAGCSGEKKPEPAEQPTANTEKPAEGGDEAGKEEGGKEEGGDEAGKEEGGKEEGGKEEGGDEAGKEEGGKEEGGDEAGKEEGGEEAAKPAEPGKIPFEFPTTATTAKAGEFVLAPPRDWIDKGFEKGGDKQTFIFYSAEVVEAGQVESKLKKIGKEEMIPNSLIIPIPKGEKAKKGDILLTWWQSGSGMKRAIVVGGSDTEPVVRYLDVDLDNPSGLGTKEDTLKPDSFHVLSKEWEAGTAVAIKSGSTYKHGIIVSKADGKVLTVGFAGRMSVDAEADVVPLPVAPTVKKGDKVWIPFVGTFRQAEVTKIDAKIGRVFVKFEFAGKDKEQAVAFGNVALKLDGMAPAEETPTKVEEPKDDKVTYDGVYKGKATGTDGIDAEIMLSLKGDKLTGNIKGTRKGGEKFNTGFSGMVKGTAVNAAGRNKNTTLSMTGDIRNPKEIKGTLTGNVNGVQSKMTYTVTR